MLNDIITNNSNVGYSSTCSLSLSIPDACTSICKTRSLSLSLSIPFYKLDKGIHNDTMCEAPPKIHNSTHIERAHEKMEAYIIVKCKVQKFNM